MNLVGAELRGKRGLYSCAGCDLQYAAYMYLYIFTHIHMTLCKISSLNPKFKTQHTKQDRDDNL